MPFLLALAGMLEGLVASLIGRALLALGLSYITYSGFDFSVTWLQQQIQTNMAGMGGTMLSFLGFMWVDKAIGVIFSAYSAALLVKMAGGTKLTKLVTKSV